MERVRDGWEFDVWGTGFTARLRIELDAVPEIGEATPLTTQSAGAMESTAASGGIPPSKN
jgi:hypothetical protein